MTLRLRLLLVLVGIVAAGLVIADVVTYTSLRSYLYSQVDQQVRAAAQPMARELFQCSQQLSYCPLGINQFSQIPSGAIGQLRFADGSVLIGACFLPNNPTSPNLPASLPISSSASAATLFSITNTHCESGSYRGVAVATSLGNPVDGQLSVVVAVPLTEVDHTLGRLLLIESLVTLAVLGALGALAWWIVRRGLRPLDEMATTAGAIAAGDLSRRVADTDLHTEVGKLGAALNTMLSGIEQAFGAQAASEERLRRFLADASHELRTPLTSIRGYAELFDRGARERPEDLAISMRHIRMDADRMAVLVDDLLLLARLDRERPLEQDHVEMAEIASAAVDSARRAAPDRVIDLDSPASAPVLGDADRLRQVLDNLLGNAVQHTAQGSPIEVHVRVEPASVSVAVTDHGAGVPEGEHERIFEPFHRSDPSRARSSGGVGLGLAIVSAIARAHGGQVGVVSNQTGGSTFWVQIPRPVATSQGVSAPEQADAVWSTS